MENKCFRQGELIFIPVKISKEIRDTILNDGKNLGLNIREGEVSGHIHAANTGRLVEVKSRTIYPTNENGGRDYEKRVELPAGEMFLTADHQIKITHPEHGTLPLDKGDYIIRIQREYDETADRLVRD